jgi:cell wall-associated NlpC family hydrolase
MLGGMRVKLLAGGLTCAVLGAGAAGYALSDQGGTASGAPPRVEASIDDWRWAPRDALPVSADEPDDGRDEARPAIDAKPAPKPETPLDDEDDTTEPPEAPEPEPEPIPDLPERPSSTSRPDAALARAEVLKNGVALPPLEAPPEVRAIFEAGNVIARSPYKWGGGHGKWQDSGYDCSGSVSYALAAAGLVTASMPSGGYMKWGKPGKGKWITIYTNPGHMFMVVAGVRFDTVARGQTGSRWINSSTDTGGYVARHPPGF